ncbi:protein of unknown function [Methylorubrum extorquens]|uniref:Uncharacterized protein n=1 Tax=Methylorubrum extorquens TaxID=408 RepID=A0A2N9ANZ0_METEX|nr:protein of unknown function [Methylorubrum extorquens]
MPPRPPARCMPRWPRTSSLRTSVHRACCYGVISAARGSGSQLSHSGMRHETTRYRPHRRGRPLARIVRRLGATAPQRSRANGVAASRQHPRLRLLRARPRGRRRIDRRARPQDPARVAQPRRPLRPARSGLAGGGDARHHRLGQRRHHRLPHGGGGDLPRALRPAARRGVRAGRRRRRRGGLDGAQAVLPPSAARSRAARHGRVHGELPIRPRDDVGDRLPHARDFARPRRAAAQRQGADAGARHRDDGAGRRQPGLSRRALAERRGGGLVRRRRLGGPVLVRRAPTPAPGRGGGSRSDTGLDRPGPDQRNLCAGLMRSGLVLARHVISKAGILS